MSVEQKYTSWEYAKAQESWALAESAYELLQAELQAADEREAEARPAQRTEEPGE